MKSGLKINYIKSILGKKSHDPVVKPSEKSHDPVVKPGEKSHDPVCHPPDPVYGLILDTP